MIINHRKTSRNNAVTVDEKTMMINLKLILRFLPDAVVDDGSLLLVDGRSFLPVKTDGIDDDVKGDPDRGVGVVGGRGVG